VKQQGWYDLNQEIGAMVTDVDSAIENPKVMADLPLLMKSRERLVAVQGALAAAE
jgi:hypothetical protein